MSSVPEAHYNGESYSFTWEEEGIAMEVSRLREDREGNIKCELLVQETNPPGHLDRLNLNLMSDRTRKSIAKDLEERRVGVDFGGMFSQLKELTITRYRDGDPLIDLSQVTPRDSRWLLPPFVEDAGISTVFAQGGTGKSFFALAIAASVVTGEDFLPGYFPERTGAVLYLDWESDEYAHAQRLQALCAPNSVEIPEGQLVYRHETASLRQTADRLVRRVREHDIQLIIIDSAGLARGGSVNSDEDTLALARASRVLGAPCLWVDHISKEVINRQGAPMSIGSVFGTNAARLCWQMSRDEGSSILQLRNSKSNNGPLSPMQAFELSFTNDEETGVPQAAAFRTLDQHTISELVPSSLSQPEQIARLLKSAPGPMDVPTIALEVGLSRDQTRVILNRSSRFTSSKDEKGVVRWGVLSAYEEDA